MRTLLMLAGEPQGITTDDIAPGDIIKMSSEKSKPVVVQHVIPMPELSNEEEISKYNINADQIAYLHIDEKIEKKFTSKKRSSKMEKIMAKTVGGKTVVGSGAFNFHKGDVTADKWLGEHKFTDANFYSLTSKTWNKIVDEAFGVNKRPIMEVVIAADTLNVRLILIDIKDFQIETDATEEEFTDTFYLLFLNSKHKSIRLEAIPIQAHINVVHSNIPEKLPAVLLTFDNLNLVGILPTDFQRIFND